MSLDDWQYLRNLAFDLLQIEELVSNLRLKYIEGVASFHLEDYVRGFQIFKELDRDSVAYGHRIIKYYLWADPKGIPRRFNGIVARVTGSGWGEIHVNEIQRRIRFNTGSTGKPDVKPGDNFDNFQIAFNFTGPIINFARQ